MYHDTLLGKRYRQHHENLSIISRATIAILACVLINAGCRGYVPDELSMLCTMAGSAALLAAIVLGTADRRRRQQWDAVLHITTARGILDRLEIQREHRKTLREFGRLLCETSADPSETQAGECLMAMSGSGHYPFRYGESDSKKKDCFVRNSLTERWPNLDQSNGSTVGVIVWALTRNPVAAKLLAKRPGP
jgi:hypothetical protein